ncbi:hypothetical protein [Psychroflexus sp. MES1-P1E]|uniref:hypothetical protein n=1 Tax=Psychroflexus sp. MES1-P1E TaxID=2058320 RepID=UPI000C7A64A6|nr:hypothetical protein [Psychroflexus sp. MES1-P1E]PKG43842.1 hypothetical protein CXF67_02865 [Psychroflexus sp. MES1-P1E]
MKIKKTFQILSYLQYPLVLVGFFFILKPYLNGFEFLRNNIEILWTSYNNALIFLGLGISMSTLQDTSKTQSKWTKKIWENPKKGKQMIYLMTFTTLLTLCLGMFGYFFSRSDILKEMSFGIIILGIGLIGFLKTAIEVFENHRIDKKTNANI